MSKNDKLEILGVSDYGPVTNAELSVVLCWAPMANTDNTEGRGAEYPLGYYESSIQALLAGKGKGVFGSDCRVKEITCVKISRSGSALYAPLSKFMPVVSPSLFKEKLRTQALAKLTPEELEVLGIKA